MNIPLHLLSGIMHIYWVPTRCRCREASPLPWAWSSHCFHVKKPSFVQDHGTDWCHHWGPNSLLWTTECRWCGRSPPWSGSFCLTVPEPVEGEYFSCFTGSEGRGLARADVQSTGFEARVTQSLRPNPKPSEEFTILALNAWWGLTAYLGGPMALEKHQVGMMALELFCFLDETEFLARKRVLAVKELLKQLVSKAILHIKVKTSAMNKRTCFSHV